jgi:poly(A) polymerase
MKKFQMLLLAFCSLFVALVTASLPPPSAPQAVIQGHHSVPYPIRFAITGNPNVKEPQAAVGFVEVIFLGIVQSIKRFTGEDIAAGGAAWKPLLDYFTSNGFPGEHGKLMVQVMKRSLLFLTRGFQEPTSELICIKTIAENISALFDFTGFIKASGSDPKVVIDQIEDITRLLLYCRLRPEAKVEYARVLKRVCGIPRLPLPISNGISTEISPEKFLMLQSDGGDVSLLVMDASFVQFKTLFAGIEENGFGHLINVVDFIAEDAKPYESLDHLFAGQNSVKIKPTEFLPFASQKYSQQIAIDPILKQVILVVDFSIQKVRLLRSLGLASVTNVLENPFETIVYIRQTGRAFADLKLLLTLHRLTNAQIGKVFTEKHFEDTPSATTFAAFSASQQKQMSEFQSAVNRYETVPLAISYSGHVRSYFEHAGWYPETLMASIDKLIADPVEASFIHLYLSRHIPRLLTFVLNAPSQKQHVIDAQKKMLQVVEPFPQLHLMLTLYFKVLVSAVESNNLKTSVGCESVGLWKSDFMRERFAFLLAFMSVESPDINFISDYFDNFKSDVACLQQYHGLSKSDRGFAEFVSGYVERKMVAIRKHIDEVLPRLVAERERETDTNQLNLYLKNGGYVKAVVDDQIREVVLHSLTKVFSDFLVAKSQNLGFPIPRQALVIPFGSYRLNVHVAGADIDTICVVPTGYDLRQTFLDFSDYLTNRQNLFKSVTVDCIVDAFVPIISAVLDGVEVDILLVFAPVDVTIPMLRNPKAAGLNLDEFSMRSLNGFRNTEDIREMVPNASVFTGALRAIKIWAKNRGIYGSTYGFPSGISYAILTARVCIDYPGAAANLIFAKFFEVYSEWPWPQMVSLGPVIPSLMWNAQIAAKGNENFMPVITPAHPCLNSTHSVTKSTKQVILRELRRASNLSVSGDGKTKEKFQPYPVGNPTYNALLKPYDDEFFSTYKNFVQVLVKADSVIRLESLKRFVASRLLTLMRDLEKSPHIVHVVPYTRTIDECVSKAVTAKKSLPKWGAEAAKKKSRASDKNAEPDFEAAFYLGLTLRTESLFGVSFEPILDSFVSIVVTSPYFKQHGTGLLTAQHLLAAKLPKNTKNASC